MEGTVRSTCCGKSRNLFDLLQLSSEHFYLRWVEHRVQENVSSRYSFALEAGDLLFFLMPCADCDNFCSFHVYFRSKYFIAKTTMKLSDSKKIGNAVNFR